MQEKADTLETRTSRRAFLASNRALAAGMCLAGPTVARAAKTPAISGGKNAVTAPAGDAAFRPGRSPAKRHFAPSLLRFTNPMPELIDQYVRAFEKVRGASRRTGQDVSDLFTVLQ